MDTSGWGNLIDQSQPYHQLTVSIYHNARERGRKIITTNYIITKLVALLTSPLHLPRNKVIKFIDGIKTSPYVEVIHINFHQDEKT